MPERGRSSSPGSRRGASRSRSFSPGQMRRTRSGSNDGMNRSRSRSPGARGRGRSRSPGGRSRSGSPGNRRGRSSSPGRRGRSSSPGARRGRSSSPGGRRQRSMSPGRRQRSGSPGGRQRSMSPAQDRGRSQDRGRGGAGRSVRHLGGKVGRGAKKVGRGAKKVGRGAKKVGIGAKNKIKAGGKRIDRSRVGQTARKIAPPEQCTALKCACYLVPITMLFVSSIGLIVATGNADKLEKITTKFDFTKALDPFAGGVEVPQWKSEGSGGLEVEFLNALDSSWQVEFQLGIADWDYGNPDALTLSSTQIDIETKCSHVEGKVKVCNGDYGSTNWRGLCEVLQDRDGFITSANVRMNEFYLASEPEARQYSMCHELGHSFGLPHSDEDFENEDLGNCMDYTFNWDINKHPDETNYSYLSNLYGVVGGRRLRRRQLESKRQSTPSHILSQMSEAVKKLEQEPHNSRKHGWRLLHWRKHGWEHELELDDGYKVRVHMLSAQNEDATVSP